MSEKGKETAKKYRESAEGKASIERYKNKASLNNYKKDDNK